MIIPEPTGQGYRIAEMIASYANPEGGLTWVDQFRLASVLRAQAVQRRWPPGRRSNQQEETS